jgi:hypothetical protein
MSVFDFEEFEPDDDQEQSRISSNGPKGYESFRMTVPKSIVEELGLTQGDMAFVRTTDNGFEVEILQT